MGVGVTGALVFLASILLPVLQHGSFVDVDLDIGSISDLVESLRSIASSPMFTSDSWPSILSSLPSSWLSSPVNEESDAMCEPDYTRVSYYDYYYYYYYMRTWYGSGIPSCACRAPPVSSGFKFQVGALLWLLGFTLTLRFLNRSNIAFMQQIRRAWAMFVSPWSNVWTGLKLDVRDIWRAIVFMCCEVTLVAARRLPYGKSTLRRFALRHRPCATLESAEPIYMSSPASAASEPRSASSSRSRRPLIAIQMEHQLLAGGRWEKHGLKTIFPARAIRTRRIPMARWRRWTTTFNPRSSTERGDCLFMVLSKFVPGRVSAKQMRMNIRSHASSLLASGDAVHNGKTMAELFVAFNIDPTWYFSTLASPRPRWGNTLDAMVASSLYKINFHIFDIAEQSYALRDLVHPDSCTIGYLRHHFVAGKVAPNVKRAPGRAYPGAAEEGIVSSLFLAARAACSAATGFWAIMNGQAVTLCRLVHGGATCKMPQLVATEMLAMTHDSTSVLRCAEACLPHTVCQHATLTKTKSPRKMMSVVDVVNLTAEAEEQPFYYVDSCMGRSIGPQADVSSGFRQGGAMHARLSTLVSNGDDGLSVHTIRNVHSLASMCERFIDEDEFVIELEDVDSFGYGMGSYMRTLEDDGRPLIQLLLRRIRRSLFAAARIGERVWNFPSSTPEPLFDDQLPSWAVCCAESDASGDSDAPPSEDRSCLDSSRTLRMQSWCSSRSSLHSSDLECESDYEPSSIGWSNDAQWSSGTTSPGSCHVASLDGSYYDDDQSCLDSNRTLRMLSRCSTRTSLCPDDFEQYAPIDGDGWSNPLQLIPLALEFWDEYNHLITQEFFEEDRRQWEAALSGEYEAAQHTPTAELLELRTQLHAIAVDR
eukprot:3384783-Amphidinium_carterae.1